MWRYNFICYTGLSSGGSTGEKVADGASFALALMVFYFECCLRSRLLL